MKKNLNNQTARMIVSIILGIIIGVVVCFIAIRLGYSHVKADSLTAYNVQVFGFSIFEIQKIGTELKGSPNNSNMMFIGIIFSMVLAIIVEVIMGLRSKEEGK